MCIKIFCILYFVFFSLFSFGSDDPKDMPSLNAPTNPFDSNANYGWDASGGAFPEHPFIGAVSSRKLSRSNSNQANRRHSQRENSVPSECKGSSSIIGSVESLNHEGFDNADLRLLAVFMEVYDLANDQVANVLQGNGKGGFVKLKRTQINNACKDFLIGRKSGIEFDFRIPQNILNWVSQYSCGTTNQREVLKNVQRKNQRARKNARERFNGSKDEIIKKSADIQSIFDALITPCSQFLLVLDACLKGEKTKSITRYFVKTKNKLRGVK